MSAGDSSGTFVFATPEDVVLHKMACSIAAGGSDRQWADLCGLLRAQRGRLDVDCMQRWAQDLGAADLLAKAMAETDA